MRNGNTKSTDGIPRKITSRERAKALHPTISARNNAWLRFTTNPNHSHHSCNYQGREDGGSANFTHVNVHASPAYSPVNPDGTASYRTGLNNYDIGDGIFAMLINGNTKGVNKKYEFTTI